METKLKPGKMRHRGQLVKPYGGAQDTSGDVNLAMTSPVVTLWCQIDTLTGRDQLVNAEMTSEVTHKITIRYRGPRQNSPITIQAQDQMFFANRVFQVKAVMNPDERTHMLVLLCVEVADSTRQNPTMSGGLL